MLAKPPRQVPRSHQGPQQLRELLAQLRDIVSLGLHELEKRAQMRRGQGRMAPVMGRLPVHQIMHAPAQILRIRQGLVEFATQALTSRRLYARLDAGRWSRFRPSLTDKRQDVQTVASGAGKRTMTRVPACPSAGDSMSKLAPCLWATSLTMASPRPVPSPGVPWMR